jgi:serine/threonine protein kinase
MDLDRWNNLSAWHNRWLEADAQERRRLREQLAVTTPDLVEQADELVNATAALEMFLETPAFVLAAERMARETPRLAPGSSVGPYLVGEVIARGGMGVVYRASDVRLHRDVALKVLAPVGITDQMQVDRFLREARVTASIDHPNVVRIYDVGVVEQQPYMVMELLDGETLRARLHRGTLTPAEVRQIAEDLAKGLSAAHAAGLVHRDLKPENVFLTRSGPAKVLDFGIAKLAPEASRPLGTEYTLTGFLVGTAGYLAPEQIKDGAVDGRADLFALGAILFECLAGRRAFAGDSTVDTLHAILHAPVPDLNDVVPGVPRLLSATVTRLLEKSPEHRFASAADLLWALEHLDEAPVPTTERRDRHVQPRKSSRPRVEWWMAASAMLTLVSAGAWWFATPPASDVSVPLTRFSWTLPGDTRLTSAPTVSPDGRRICWTAIDETGTPHLFVRELSSANVTMMAGTAGARHPFWAPDSTSVGFFAQQKLKKVALAGGTPVVLADAPDARGGAWSPRGVILFQPLYRDSALMRVSDQGGAIEPATVLDRAQEEVTHRWPSFLPDGIHFLYQTGSQRDERRGVYLGSLNGTGRPAAGPLFPSESGAVYVPLRGQDHGVLLSAVHGLVEVRPFDPVRRVLTGDARTIDVDVVETSPHHAALLSASADVLVHAGTAIPWGLQFATIHSDGRQLQVSPDRLIGGFPRLSPDGRFLAHMRLDAPRGNPDIWLDDLVRGTRLRLTTSSDFDVMPVWSPDGREVAFRSGRLTEPTIGFAAADGSGLTRTRPCPRTPCEPTDWTGDGASLVLTVGGRDVWLLPIDDGATPQPLLTDTFVERDARISPDGQWIAYVSDQSGRPEVSIRSLRGTPRRSVVSVNGGDQPVWDRAGAGLYFVGPGGRLHHAPIRVTQGTLEAGVAALLPVPALGERHWGTIYDVSREGLVHFPHPTAATAPREFGVVMGWQALLE